MESFDLFTGAMIPLSSPLLGHPCNQTPAKFSFALSQPYYHKLKFMKACFLLQNTDVSIRTISEKLQFYDESHFTRFFKKQCGQIPSQYHSSSRTL